MGSYYLFCWQRVNIIFFPLTLGGASAIKIKLPLGIEKHRLVLDNAAINLEVEPRSEAFGATYRSRHKCGGF